MNRMMLAVIVLCVMSILSIAGLVRSHIKIDVLQTQINQLRHDEQKADTSATLYRSVFQSYGINPNNCPKLKAQHDTAVGNLYSSPAEAIKKVGTAGFEALTEFTEEIDGYYWKYCR